MNQTPLQMAVKALENKAATSPLKFRDFYENAAAIARSFEDYDPDWELEQYKQGFKDALKIYSDEAKIYGQYQPRQDGTGTALPREKRQILERNDIRNRGNGQVRK